VLAAPAIASILEQKEGLFLPVVSGTGVPGAQVAIMVDSKRVALALWALTGHGQSSPKRHPDQAGPCA